MKNRKWTFIAVLLCVSLIAPQFTVLANEVEENPGIEETEEIKEIEDLEESETVSSDKTEELDTVSADKAEELKTVSSDKTEELDTVSSDKAEESETVSSDEIQKMEMPKAMKAARPMLYAATPPGEPETGEHGSGSYQLNEESSDYRFYTEYFVDGSKSFSTAGVDRRTSIKVYAKKGEILLFGSSVYNSEIDENNKYTKSVTGKDIVITTPSGNKVCENVLKPGEKDSEGNEKPYGLGYISNPTQEKYGPMVNHTDANNPDKYYVPLQYEVKESGVYTFEFHSVTGYNPGSISGYHPSPKLASKDWYQGNTSVAAWDITVIGKNEENKWVVKSGRAWADYLALTTGGGAGIESDLNVHVLTHDGFQYEVDFEKAVPYGFIFFANNTGFMTAVTDEESNTTYRPIYHSFYDSDNDLVNMNSENIYLHKPNEADTKTEETYKIFFNEPNEDLDGVTYIKDGKEDKIITKPIDTVSINNLTFNGDSHPNIARTGHGGNFTFEATGEAMVTIRLDLRKAILDSDSLVQELYRGSGIVEITVPAVSGNNTVYWDGKDTEGKVLPAGIYGNSNVVIAAEIKRGELHFPVIDMEGLDGGLTVKRINGSDAIADPDNAILYNLYYNNNPLVYGTIEGSGYKKTVSGSHYVMSDGTKSYKSYTDRGVTLSKYFKYGADTISTLKKDDLEYLAHKFFNANYASLEDEKKAIIDAEFNIEDPTFHFEPVNSKSTTMKFACENFDGGGNQSGIDAWTYYEQGINSQVISFAILDGDERGIVKGQIFYDANKSSSYDPGDHFLPGVKVRLIDEAGEPVKHIESLPCFDDKGNFEYDENGKVKHKDTPVVFETVTDSTGTYRFTNVPYLLDGTTTYYVQVQLSDVQSEVLRYSCTTSEKIKNSLITKDNIHFHVNSIDPDYYGADGNAIAQAPYTTKIYGYKYDRDANNEIKFDLENTQSVRFTTSDITASDFVCTEEFKMIGYCTALPTENQKDYQVSKNWGTDSEGNPTHHISDGVIVELWVWNDSAIEEENKWEISRRTGALIDTQVLTEENHWTCTWEKLDDRLQYYVLEYYTKKKPNGEIIYNDKGEPRRVLIGGTMPIFSKVPADNTGVYKFDTNLGDYPGAYKDSSTGKICIPIQKFSDGGTYTNSITDKEKLESVDNNARQYDVTYNLSVSGTTNVIELNNSQVFDDRAYYVWLDHETELPDLIAQTYVVDGSKNSHAVVLQKDKPISDGEYTIKGLSVSSIDAAQSDNVEGNATNAFRIKDDGKCSSLFTATNHGNYKTGTGTRTYQVKYVVDKTSNEPVSITTNQSHELVLADNESIKVETNSNYKVYSWYMTIHVYDVQSDGVIEYDPNNGPVILQEALPASGEDHELKWKLTHYDENTISYISNDKRTFGILRNDTYRLPLYKAAENPHMGSCADLVGIAYAGPAPVENVSSLIFADTYESRYGSHTTDENGEDGIAIAQGSGGYVTATLNTTRITRINRVQDHANYANVTFTPGGMARAAAGEDVFYYKIIVFAEDSTYQYDNYEDIDASEGVVMYAYFIMKPKAGAPSGKPNEGPVIIPPDDPNSGSNCNRNGNSSNGSSFDPNDEQEANIANKPAENPLVNPKDNSDDNANKDNNKSIVVNTDNDANSPKTGEDQTVFLWMLIAHLVIGVICGWYLYKKRQFATSNEKMK